MFCTSITSRGFWGFTCLQKQKYKEVGVERWSPSAGLSEAVGPVRATPAEVEAQEEDTDIQ